MKKISKKQDKFGVPLEEDIIFEMANLRINETGLPCSVHIRTKEEVKRTTHSESQPCLKIYQERPGKSDNFTMTIADDPETIESQKNNIFLKKISAKDLKQIKKWILINKIQLLNFWENGQTWFEDEVAVWKNSLSKI